MARVKLSFPDKKPAFSTKIQLRITDMNYGNHMGNDVVLSIVHEARVQYLASMGCSELDVGGCGLIMSDAMIAYRSEGHYGDMLQVDIFPDALASRSFELLYRISVLRNGAIAEVARVQTGMAGFDYEARKVCALPGAFLEQLCR